jgi:hypothetical protein
MGFFRGFSGFFQISFGFRVFFGVFRLLSVSGFFGFRVFSGFFWVSGAPMGKKWNAHPNLVLHGSGSGHGCKNAPEPVGCKTRGLPEIRTRTVIPIKYRLLKLNSKGLLHATLSQKSGDREQKR